MRNKIYAEYIEAKEALTNLQNSKDNYCVFTIDGKLMEGGFSAVTEWVGFTDDITNREIRRLRKFTYNDAKEYCMLVFHAEPFVCSQKSDLITIAGCRGPVIINYEICKELTFLNKDYIA